MNTEQEEIDWTHVDGDIAFWIKKHASWTKCMEFVSYQPLVGMGAEPDERWMRTLWQWMKDFMARKDKYDRRRYFTEDWMHVVNCPLQDIADEAVAMLLTQAGECDVHLVTHGALGFYLEKHPGGAHSGAVRAMIDMFDNAPARTTTISVNEAQITIDVAGVQVKIDCHYKTVDYMRARVL